MAKINMFPCYFSPVYTYIFTVEILVVLSPLYLQTDSISIAILNGII